MDNEEKAYLIAKQSFNRVFRMFIISQNLYRQSKGR